VFSSCRIQKRLPEDVAFRVLAAGNQPDFRTISDFRKLHLKALEELFRQGMHATLRNQNAFRQLRPLEFLGSNQ
jgi:transposase